MGAQLKSITAEQSQLIAAIIDALVDMSARGDLSTIDYSEPGIAQMLDMDQLISTIWRREKTASPSRCRANSRDDVSVGLH